MSTRSKVRELRVDNPRATLEAIGEVVDRTRQRVFEILKGEGLPTAAVVDRVRLFCKTCGKKLDPINKSGYCIKHRRDGLTHCPHGHPYDEENTRFGERGKKMCRTCLRERAHRYYHPSV